MANDDEIRSNRRGGRRNRDQGGPGPEAPEEGSRFKFDGPQDGAPFRKTFERNNYTTYGDRDIRNKLNDKGTAGRLKGTDAIPQGLGGAFPAEIKSPSLEGSLGDWQQSYDTSIFGSYPGIDPKTGYTDISVYPQDITRQNFDINKLKSQSQPVLERIEVKKKYYNLFDDPAGKQFTHLLDYFSDQKQRAIPVGDFKEGETVAASTKDIYLGSFIKTLDDNDEPTMLGFDIKMKYADSPLLNGTAESFIKQFGDLGNSEIKSRSEILEKFKTQLNKFFRNDSSITTDSPTFNGSSGVKTYYLKKIGGISRLNDQTEDVTAPKQFIEYGKDFITLGFYEDVTQNLGYLATLYKALSYSRINGKQVLPENVLRFDVDIEITEIRKYNRVFKNEPNNTLEFVADKIAKYTYTLYECQFFFPNMPHGEALDMSAPSTVDDYEIKFNYKFSTLKFSKFSYSNEVTKADQANPSAGGTFSLLWTENFIDNRNLITTKVKPSSTDNNKTDGKSIQSSNPTFKFVSTGTQNYKTGEFSLAGMEKGGDLEAAKKAEESKAKTETKTPEGTNNNSTNAEIPPTPSDPGPMKKILEESAYSEALENALKSRDTGLPNGLERLGRQLANVLVGEINSQIINQAGLLNKTLGNILNLLPGGGGISAPRNVYNQGNRTANNITNTIGNFVGQSVRGFFTRR